MGSNAPDPRRGGRWSGVVASAIGLLAGWLAFLPHRSAWVGHNGDHLYYASGALQYAGVGYEASLRLAAEYFHYPLPANRLDLGYLDPVVAPLLYPRVVLGLLATPVVRVVGIEGVWVPGLACGALSVLVLTGWAVRRIGPLGGAVLPVLIGITWYAPEFMFGIYAEAPVVLATAVLLTVLPLGPARRTWWRAVTAAGLVPVMMLSRQVPLLPVGIVLGGYLWALVGSRRLANPWWPFVALVLPATALSYGAIAQWAPYDALPFLYARTGTSTPAELMRALPGMWSVSIGQDWARVLDRDLPLLVVVALALIGLVLTARHPIAGVLLGTVASGTVTELLNGQPNDFRYFAPCLPVVLILAAFAVVAGLRAGVRLAGQVTAPWPGQHWRGPARWPADDTSAAPGPWAARRPVIAAAGAWLTVAAFVAGAMAVHARGSLDLAAEARVSSAALPGPWPLTVPEGTLRCAGDDYQIWLDAPDGVRYAVSGTAMATGWRVPWVARLAPGPIPYGWPDLRPLLSAGMRLCGSERDFEQSGGRLAR